MENIIFQGEDKIIELLLLKDGQTVDVSQATGLVVVLYIHADEESGQYNLFPTQGFLPLLLDANVPNKLIFSIESAQSRKFDAGLLTAMVQVDLPNSNFSSGTERQVILLQIGRIMPNPAKDL